MFENRLSGDTQVVMTQKVGTEEWEMLLASTGRSQGCC